MPAVNLLRVDAGKPFSNGWAMTILVAQFGPTLFFLAAALLLASRRLAGALVVAPSPTVAAACGGTIGVLLWASHVARRSRADAYDWLIPGVLQIFLFGEGLVQLVAAAVVAGSLSIAGIRPSSLVLLWLPVIGTAAWMTWQRARPIRDRRIEGEDFVCAKPQALGPNVSLMLTRTVDAVGRDVVEGTVVARFAAGERFASVHLAFCPPFARTPTIAFHTLGDVAADVKAAQIVPYAARFDVKLRSAAAAPLEIPLTFVASPPVD
jgi:hypothetical protein